MESRLDLPGLSLPLRTGAVVRVGPGDAVLSGCEVVLTHPFGLTRFYRHGWQSWSPTSWVRLGTPPVPLGPPLRRIQADDPVYADSPVHGGSGLGALDGGDGRILLLGALGIGARVEADGRTLRGFYERGADAPGEWFVGLGDERDLFGRYAELIGRRLGRRGRGLPPRVWCSWYSLYQQVSEEALKDVLRDLQGFPFDVVQIDDGWQADVGDWEANERFPSGMDGLAQQIRARGFTPGLWLAPFLVRSTSRLFCERQDWLLRDGAGHPVLAGFNWGDVTYALDVTHPEVIAWLGDLVRRVGRWGYRYLKLDFLYAGALPGVRRAALPREAAYRRALAEVRAAAPDAYILVCGAPVLPSVGLADAMRIGPDCAPFWAPEDRTGDGPDGSSPAARNALRTSLHRLWLRALVHADPDVVYFRTRETRLTPEQRAALRDLAEITGFKGTSDPPAWLAPAERAALRAFLESRPSVKQLDRYRFLIGDRLVDFRAFAGSEGETT